LIHAFSNNLAAMPQAIHSTHFAAMPPHADGHDTILNPSNQEYTGAKRIHWTVRHQEHASVYALPTCLKLWNTKCN